jgi:hypothetical protein
MMISRGKLEKLGGEPASVPFLPHESYIKLPKIEPKALWGRTCVQLLELWYDLFPHIRMISINCYNLLARCKKCK